ncbi:MAG: two-component regulator propeller domain-containing protein [Bacteroidota bacterium]
MLKIVRVYWLRLILLGCVPLLGLRAQTIKFEHYNNSDGLSHNSVRHIVQDKNGYLWLGTFSGLNRFDGYEFKSYSGTSNRPDALPNDDITALELDRESNDLWIGTRKGLALFNIDTNVFRTFLPDGKDPKSIQDEEIRSIHIDRFKQVWIGAKNNGLSVYDPESDSFDKIELPGFKYIKEIFEDSNGNIWIGSYAAAGIAKISLNNLGKISQIKQYSLRANSQEANPYINFIYEDHKLDVFVGSRDGLFKLDQKADTFKNIPIHDAAVRDKLGPYFISVARSPEGKYWMGTLGGIVVVENLEEVGSQELERYYSELSDDDSLVDNLVSALYFDDSGALWIGTEDGLDKYNPYKNQFKLNKTISDFIDNQAPRIRGFSKTHTHKVVVATRHNGLFVADKEAYVPFFKIRKDIASIYSHNGKIFYCGLWSGQVLVYNAITQSSRVVDVGFSQFPILAYTMVGEDRLLLGSHGDGAVVLNTKTLVPENSEGLLLPGSYINQIRVDAKGRIWFATQSGVVRYDPETQSSMAFKARTAREKGVSHENVSDIAEDMTGKIWAATRKGLDYYDVGSNNFVPVLAPKELDGSWITDIIVDAKGHLWLNMNNNRVGRYHIASKELKVYYLESGNRLDIFSSRGFYYGKDGKIYLAGKNGVISFSSYGLKNHEISPKPMITAITVQNKKIEVGSVVNGQKILDKDINFSRELKLANANKNFSLTFSSPSYIDELHNQYSYTLEGFDEVWNTVDPGQRTVQYTNLFFGDYVFKVKAMNAYGIWSDVSSYKIRILPPFWLSYEAGLAFLALVLLLVYLGRRQVKARIALRNQLLMEKLKREHDEKLNEEKLRFFTNISHELRTPLTLILGPAKQLMEKGFETGNLFHQSKSNLILRNAERLLNLVNQVLDFRRAQSGELRLKVTKTQILDYTKSTFRSFVELAHDKRIHYGIICENETLTGYIDRDKYDKILYNLLSNALKFTHKYGHVDLFIGQEIEDGKTRLIVEVNDDGIGIPVKSQQKIFSRFYQAANSKENNTGSGIGLSLVQALVRLHKGTIKVESEPGQGSSFTVKLPIARESYREDEVFELGQNKPVGVSLQRIDSKALMRGAHLKERILIIEDNAELRSYLVNYFSNTYKVFEAEEGGKGLQICQQVKPSVCVVDVMMPVMDGLEFCKKLKTDTNISHIPIILLTALSDNDDKIRGYDSGADGYLVKPFDPSLLKTRIDNIIRSRKDLKVKFSGEIESKATLLTHSPADEDFMEKITHLIQKNLSNTELNTSLLCSELGMSSSKLYRKIKELTDLAPNEFIRTMRLKESAVLLKTKKYNVSEVTDFIGFNDPYYFSRCFKKQFGYPPSQLIK